ncbi:MAG: methionine--tRNA ligase subunit beta, partial [Thermoanaerobaculia bacterium]
FGADALRYFLMREMAFGQDAYFSDQAFLARYNADLANDLGNTVSRVAALCRQSFGATPGETCPTNDIRSAYKTALPEWRSAMEEFSFNRALDAVWRFLAEINGYIVSREPWKVRKEEGVSPRLHRILYAAAEGVRLCAVLLHPFVPVTSRRIFQTFGLPGQDPAPEDLSWGRLQVDVPLTEQPALFPRADAGEYFEAKDKNMTEPVNPPPGASASVSPVPSEGRIGIEEFQKVKLVTGRVLAAERVPKSNRLVKLQIDLGGEERQIVAGIAARYEPEVLVGRNVVVVANLRPAKLMGVESDGMVLAATVGEKGEPVLLDVPADVPPGSKVK